MRRIKPVVKVAALTVVILGERRLRTKAQRAGFHYFPSSELPRIDSRGNSLP